MFQVDKSQIRGQKLTVTIHENDDGPAMRIIKRYDFATEKVLPAKIINSINFGLHQDAESATKVSEWYRLAASTAKTMDVMFKARADLSREVKVRLVAGTVTITFED